MITERSAGRFSDDQRELVRARSDIVQIVSERVPLEKRGSRFVARCPFHEEKTASFNVDPAKGLFHCFGCKKGGDVFTFVMEIERVTFPEALRIVADKVGVELAPPSPGERERSRRRGEALDALRRVAEYYASRLWTGDGHAARAGDFLERRRVHPDTARAFGLGVAPSGTTLLSASRAIGVAPKLLEELKLVQRGGESNEPYDFFRDRLIFPIRDEGERVVGFGGRTLLPKEEMERRGVKKFTNSYELEGIFEKRRILYGLDRVRAAGPRPKRLVVVEGYLDVIVCHQEGAANVVAALGTGFTRQHAQLARRFADGAVILFDGDRAGEAAARRTLEELVREPLDLSVATLPTGDDPDDFVLREGKARFEELVAGARELVDHLVEHVVRNRGATVAERAKAIEGVASVLARIEDEIRLDVHLTRVAQRLGVSEDVLRDHVVRARSRDRSARIRAYDYPDKRAAGKGGAAAPRAEPATGPVDPAVREAIGYEIPGRWPELQAIEALLAKPKATRELPPEVGPDLLSEGPLRAIAAALFEEARTSGPDDGFAARVLARLGDDLARDVCGRIIARIETLSLQYDGYTDWLLLAASRTKRESLLELARAAQARGDQTEADRILTRLAEELSSARQ